MDKFMSMVTSNLPPGMDKLPEGVDIKVHVMQMPIGPVDGADVAVRSSSPAPTSPQTPKSRFSRFPGFMRSIKKKVTGIDDAGDGDTMGRTESVKREIGDDDIDVLSYFEKVPLTPSKEHSVRMLWDQMIDDDVSIRVRRRNNDTLSSALTAADINFNTSLLALVEDSLGSHVFSKDEAKFIVATAFKNEAASRVGGDSHETTREIKLSPWALDSAIAAVLRAPASKVGQFSWELSSSLSKQDLNTLVTDKHERSLLGNVMFPGDIGVSYDMIGGLTDVKELLKQSITYPLKYPRLYREGIAGEAVKGVLLFGESL